MCCLSHNTNHFFTDEWDTPNKPSSAYNSLQWQQSEQFLDSCDPPTSAAIAAWRVFFYSPGTGWGQGVRRAKDVTCDEWEDGLSARFLKSATIIRRDVTPVKQSFEVPICIVEANKGIFATSSLTRELYSKQGKKTRGRRGEAHCTTQSAFVWIYMLVFLLGTGFSGGVNVLAQGGCWEIRSGSSGGAWSFMGGPVSQITPV